MSDNHDNASAEAAPEAPPWLTEIGQAAGALRELASAQWQLLGAELRLARTAAWIALLATVLAVAFAVALGVTLLALLTLGLAYWFGSWIWALVAVAVLLILGLIASFVLLRCCVHWLSLPGTRAQWHSLMRAGSAPARPPSTLARTTKPQREADADEHASKVG